MASSLQPRAVAANSVWCRQVALAFLVVSGCQMPPYQPETVPVPISETTFATVADVARARFPRLLVCDPKTFRMQSDWVEAEDGVVPGRRRLTVFSSVPGRVAVVVEVSWLHTGLDSTPYWSAPVGDAAAERELAAALRAAFAVGEG